jgi:hypothetical protein
MAKPATDEEKAQWVRAYERMGRANALGNLFGRCALTIKRHLIDVGVYVDPKSKNGGHPWRQPLIRRQESATQEGLQQQDGQQEHQGTEGARQAAEASRGNRAGGGAKGQEEPLTTT